MPSFSTPVTTGRNRLATLAVLVVAASLALAACGDDDSGDTSTSRSAEATGATGASGATGESGSTESLDQLESALRENLTGPQGLTDEQADCAIDKIFDAVSEEELRKAATTGDVPNGLFDAAFDAGVKCAS